jgi:hypothetical protein
MTYTQMEAEAIVNEMKMLWGGELPSWQEFRAAAKSGRVSANRTIAAGAIHMNGMPKPYSIIHGIITLWAGFLLFPITLITWFFGDYSGWWVFGAFCTSWFLIRVAREGHCQGMVDGAVRHEELYKALVSSGAFLFEPIKGE